MLKHKVRSRGRVNQSAYEPTGRQEQLRGVCLHVYPAEEGPKGGLVTAPSFTWEDGASDAPYIAAESEQVSRRHCAVLAYGGSGRNQVHIFPWVTIGGGGAAGNVMQWVPKPSIGTLAPGQTVVDWLQQQQAAAGSGLPELDGEHVILEPLDGNWNMPIAVGPAPVRTEGERSGREESPVEAPTQPGRKARHLSKYAASDAPLNRLVRNGSVLEFDKSGHLIVDLSFAGTNSIPGLVLGTAAEVAAEGADATLPPTGEPVTVILRAGQTVKIVSKDDPARRPEANQIEASLEWSDSGLAIGFRETGGANPLMSLLLTDNGLELVGTPAAGGGGLVVSRATGVSVTQGLALAQKLQTLLEGWKTSIENWAATHVHTSAAPGSPTTVATTPLSLTSWDPTIESQRFLTES